MFLLFAFCIISFSIIFFTLSIDKPYIGITFSMNAQGWTVESVEPDGISRQAGIREGDKPIEINGQAAEAFLKKYRDSGLYYGIEIRELSVVDDNGKLKSVALEGSSLPFQSLIRQIIWLFVSLIFWIAGLYVFLKRPRNIATMLLCLFGLVIGLMLSSNITWPRGISIAIYFEILATAIGPWLLLHLFFILPEERTSLRNNPLMYAIYLPAVITLILFPIIGLNNGQPVLWFKNVRYIEAGTGLLVAAGVIVFNFLSAASVRTRQQMKIILVSCLISLIPFSVLNLFPTAIWGQNIVPSEFSILLVCFIPVGMGYAIITQKLMDIDIFIRRGVIYTLITLIIAAILSAVITVILIATNVSIGTREVLLISLGLGITATVLMGPVRKGVEMIVDKFLYKDRYDYRQIIQSLSISLNSVTDIVGISRLIVGTVVNTLNLAGSCLFIKSQSGSFQVSAAQGAFMDVGKQNQFLALISHQDRSMEFPNSASSSCPDLAFLVTLLGGERKVGVLCISQKVSRQDFSSNDIFLLQEIGSIAAISIHSAMLIRDVSIRDTFVSVASHELRTPLTSIMGYTDLLLRRDPPDVTKKQWIKNIFENSQRLSGMVDDLLNVSRIQSGKINIKLESISLSEVLEDMLSLSRGNTDKHEFVVDVEHDLPDVLIDRDKFSQVLGNLLSNAIKYSPNGGRITLTAHKELPNRYIKLSITDEGIGISAEDKESLFTTFHRIQRPETKGIRGSGLGLYIAKEWTEAMGGKIWFESELNKGTTFFVTIPIQDSPIVSDKKVSHLTEI
jgi:signal transduction histidine kinase